MSSSEHGPVYNTPPTPPINPESSEGKTVGKIEDAVQASTATGLMAMLAMWGTELIARTQQLDTRERATLFVIAGMFSLWALAENFRFLRSKRLHDKEKLFRSYLLEKERFQNAKKSIDPSS
jgi:hypothetical protein